MLQVSSLINKVSLVMIQVSPLINKIFIDDPSSLMIHVSPLMMQVSLCSLMLYALLVDSQTLRSRVWSVVGVEADLVGGEEGFATVGGGGRGRQ